MITASAPELEIDVTIPRVFIWRMRMALCLLKLVKALWPEPCQMTVTIGDRD